MKGDFLLSGAKKKSLTIGNTDRYFNLHVIHRDDIDSMVKVTEQTEDKILQELEKLEQASRRYTLKDDQRYLYFNRGFNNDRLLDLLTSHGGEVHFYTTTTVPYYVLKQLAKNKNSSVIYGLSNTYTHNQIDNIGLSYMATHVTMDIPVVIPDINPYKILDNLSNLKTNVDEVQLSFPRLKEIRDNQKPYYSFDGEMYDVKPEEKIKYAEYLRNSLSIWKMYLYIIANTDKDYKALDKSIKATKNKRSGKRK